MPSPSETELDLPSGIAESDVLEWSHAYAPLVRFDRAEVHFPSDPDAFMTDARFRESRPSARDRGWSKTRGEWVTTNDRSPEYFGVGWEAIAEASRLRLPGEGPITPWQSPNARPWDDRNVAGSPERPTVWGHFLERDDALERRRSGPPPRNGRIEAPLFVDVAYHAPAQSFRILYWFFYEMNRWKWFTTHEGDWEHVSFVVSESALRALEPPSTVYFAQHNTGDLRPFTSLEPFEDGHRTVYVDKDGHPTNPHAANPSDYPIEWRTWECPIRLVVKEAWRDFAGAWGEVGNLTDFTGPLGPLFKRDRDLVRVTRRDGRLFVRTHKK